MGGASTLPRLLYLLTYVKWVTTSSLPHHQIRLFNSHPLTTNLTGALSTPYPTLRLRTVIPVRKAHLLKAYCLLLAASHRTLLVTLCRTPSMFLLFAICNVNVISSGGYGLPHVGFSNQNYQPPRPPTANTPAGLNELGHANSGANAPRNPSASPHVNNNHRPPGDYRSVYRHPKNSSGRFDCFEDCLKARLGTNGFKRRGNLWAHLRDCHGQDIPLWG